MNVASLAALGVLLTSFLRLNEFQAFLYRGGFVLTSLAAATLIAATVHAPDTFVGRIFAWTPLRWIGVRSYGIYLWHFPVLMVTRPQLDVALDGFWLLAARLAMTVLLAAFSYRFLELPIRQGAVMRFWHAWRAARGREHRWLGICGVTVVTSLTALFLVFGLLLFTAETPSPPAYLTAMTAANNNAGISGWAGPPDPPPPLEAARAAPAPYLPATEKRTTTQTAATASPCATTANTISGAKIVAIGDSVMLGVRDELRRMLGTNVIVDAAVGRQARHALAEVRKLHAAGQIRPIVILHIGANGFISANMFDKIMAELADAREVLVLNVKVPRPWETPNNEMLAEAIPRYPKAVLVDWHAASENRPEIFWKDGHHLRPQGASIYTDLIAQALCNVTEH